MGRTKQFARRPEYGTPGNKPLEYTWGTPPSSPFHNPKYVKEGYGKMEPPPPSPIELSAPRLNHASSEPTATATRQSNTIDADGDLIAPDHEAPKRSLLLKLTGLNTNNPKITVREHTTAPAVLSSPSSTSSEPKGKRGSKRKIDEVDDAGVDTVEQGPNSKVIKLLKDEPEPAAPPKAKQSRTAKELKKASKSTGSKPKTTTKVPKGATVNSQSSESSDAAKPTKAATDGASDAVKPADEATDGASDAVKPADEATDEASNGQAQSNGLLLWTPAMKRSERILDPENPEDAALIRQAIEDGKEVGDEVYPDDPIFDLAGEVKNIKQAHLFRNVRWGDGVYRTNDADWKPTEFTQFVPGRWERMPDGTIRDQKEKLIVRITDNAGVRRIFRNEPPKNWTCQAALTALNKRTVQQIRRNTNVRFRAVVHPYAQEERQWILANLLQDKAKPLKGWNRFVTEFNEKFEDAILAEFPDEKRPPRTHSSLTKEVERFSEFYKKGVIPIPVKENEKRQVGGRKAGRVQNGKISK